MLPYLSTIIGDVWLRPNELQPGIGIVQPCPPGLKNDAACKTKGRYHCPGCPCHTPGCTTSEQQAASSRALCYRPWRNMAVGFRHRSVICLCAYDPYRLRKPLVSQPFWMCKAGLHHLEPLHLTLSNKSMCCKSKESLSRPLPA